MNEQSDKTNDFTKTASGKVAWLGILCALSVGFSFLEGFIPTLPIPGAKLGLSNIVTMFAMATLGYKYSIVITLVKAMAALTRGPVSAMLSLAGGLLSTTAMFFMYKLTNKGISFIGIAVVGAVVHNIAQLIVALFVMGFGIMYLLPLLILFAIIAGTITGILLNIIFCTLAKSNNTIAFH